MRRRITLAVVAVAAIGAVVWAAYAATRPSSASQDVRRAQPERVFAARFSLETSYHACRPDPAFADSIVQRETCAKIRDAEDELDLHQLAAGGESLVPDSLRASAVAAVFWGSASAVSLDSAIQALTAARELARDSVPILVELSFVHLARAELTQDAVDVLWGLEYARVALEQEPGNVLALFNAALATQAFALVDMAVAAWDAYLAVDSTSAWAEEARARRARIVAEAMPAAPGPAASAEEVNAFARAFPQRAREHGWDWALGQWGAAVLVRKATRADSMLALAERLGTALERDSGDASLADAVRAIREASDDAATADRLARAHRLYAVGVELSDTGQRELAADTFAGALRLAAASEPLRGWARVSYGAALHAAGRSREAVSILEALLGSVDSIRQPVLMARARWALGQAGGGENRDSLFLAARRAFADLREWENYGGLRYRDAWAAHDRGDATEAYRSNQETLGRLRPYRASRHLHRTLVQAAEVAARDGMPRVAKLLQDEDDRVAARGRLPTNRVEALLARARSLALADSNQQAVVELEAVRSDILALRDTVQTRYFSGALLYSSALVESSIVGSCTRIAMLDSALAMADPNTAWPLVILLRRAELQLQAGELVRAEADLRSLNDRNPTGRLRREDFYLREAVKERLRGSYDRLVMGYLRAGHPDRALLALDQARVSFAPDTSRQKAAGRWVAPAPGRVVLEYALIGDTLLTWVVRHDSITVREQRLDRDSLLRTIARVGVALGSPRRARTAADDLQGLYDVLIRPVRDRIPRGPHAETELAIVADGEIAGVPFAALMDSVETRYLVQDHPIRFASVLADAARAPSLAPVDGRALLVADPAFDPSANRPLGSLPGADAEVDTLQSIYPDHARLDDSSATPAAFRELAGRFPVIHYAGHAVFDESRPERSYLLMAGEGLAGRLTADSVGSMRLDGVRLVVLSACRTLRGRPGRSGGFAGLSGALLSAGADGVVGSLWLVDDDLTQDLMLHFHQAYRAERDPARALRAAQLRMIDEKSEVLSSPAVWAGFRYMGQ